MWFDFGGREGGKKGEGRTLSRCVPCGLSKAIPELLALVTWGLPSSGYPPVFSLQTLDSFYSKQQAHITPAAHS